MSKLSFLILVLSYVNCTFAQIENYISDNIFENCNKKCYIMIKIPEIVYREAKDDSMVTAQVNEDSRMLLKESIHKDIALINTKQLDTVKFCNSSVLLIDVVNYTKNGGSMGLSAGAVIVKFLYFENVNNTKPDKEIETTGIGKALWGDLNVFSSAYQDALTQYRYAVAPNRFRLKPINKRTNQ